MKKLFFLLAVLVLVGLAKVTYAQQDYPRPITLSWTNPDMYTDGTSIEAGDLENIRIEVYRQNDTVPVFVATIPDNGEGLAQSETFDASIPQPGTYEVIAYAIVVGGEESDASAPAFKKYTGKPRQVILRTFE